MRRSNPSRLPSILARSLRACVAGAARAEVCAPEQFAAAVDKSGAALRAFNAEALPKLRAKLKELKDKRGWDDADYEEKGLADRPRSAQRSSTPTPRTSSSRSIRSGGRPPTSRPTARASPSSTRRASSCSR